MARINRFEVSSEVKILIVHCVNRCVRAGFSAGVSLCHAHQLVCCGSAFGPYRCEPCLKNPSAGGKNLGVTL